MKIFAAWNFFFFDEIQCLQDTRLQDTHLQDTHLLDIHLLDIHNHNENWNIGTVDFQKQRMELYRRILFI